MNTRLVFNFLGRILIFFSLMLLLPIAVSIYFQESYYPFILAMVFSLTIGAILYFFKPKNEILRYKEAFAIVALGWLSVSIIGCIPYLVIGVNFIDSFFESMSGFTTTGASIFDKPEDLPKSILFWRALTQWLGGMGIIVLFVAVLPSVARKGAALFQAEYPGVELERIKPRLRDTALILYSIYLLFTISEFSLLYMLGLTPFDAITHTFTTLSTGGFSTHSESIAYFKNPAVEAVIAIFAAIGGMNFAIHYHLLRGEWRYLRDMELKVYIFILLLATIILAILNLEKFGILESLRYSTFQAISIMTTTGYTTYDFDKWNDGARLILLILMFIGGCSGSTGGGMKITRIYILTKYSILQVFKAAEPRIARTIKYGDIVIKKDMVDDVVAFFILYITIFIFSTLFITTSGFDIITSASAVAANIGNVGPALGLAGASETYSAFPLYVKLILIMDMWIGRLEIFTVLSLFVPSFWREKW
ncbi:TrkH family potassium uptake protein [Archaeoglobales archaeon]|nr:MAG: TrkH family potassium uptake protein [Archaeoglobales archaeon]